MTDKDAVVERKRPTKRFRAFAMKAVLGLVAVYLVGSWIWRFSGSNEWELSEEYRGMKIYSLKTPGIDLMQFKGVIRLRSSLSSIVAAIQDDRSCQNSLCYDSNVIELATSASGRIGYSSLKMDLMPESMKWLPGPTSREYVIGMVSHQNPNTKEVLLEVSGASFQGPPSDGCCFRVTSIGNHWRLTPKEKGWVEVEYLVNADLGGGIPYFAMNVLSPLMFKNMRPLLYQSYTKTFRSIKQDFVTEP